MPATLLRLFAKSELLAWLQQQQGAPFHLVLWDGSPVRLDEALARAESLEDGAHCYCGGGQIFTPAQQSRLIPSSPPSRNGRAPDDAL